MSSGDVGSVQWMEGLMAAVEAGAPPVPLHPEQSMLERRGSHLCIGCWYAECDGHHPDPDLACVCCAGLVPIPHPGEPQ